MLAFIIPLRSQKVSNSWSRVTQLFERTLKSVCNQTSLEFKVIVICHERPDIAFDFPQVTYIEVDFPAPVQGQDLKAKEKDKSRKIWTGLNYARDLNCSHAMVVDADDCISNRVAEFVSHNTYKNGWFIESGYEYEEGAIFVRVRTKNLHQKTGTSNIIRLDLLTPEINTNFEDIEAYFLDHQIVVSLMKKRGTSLEPLPFSGTLYVTETGENIWAQKKLFWQREKTVKGLARFYLGQIYKAFITQPLTQSIRDEFSVYNLLSSSNLPSSEILSKN